MASVLKRPTNGISFGSKYTVTAQDVIDGYVLFDYQLFKFSLASAFDIVDSSNITVPFTDGRVTYPAVGQVKLSHQISQPEISTVTAIADSSAVKEVSLITTIADTGVAEISNVITVPDSAGSLNNTYFTFSSPTVDYYAWINVNSTGSDPTIAGKTAIEVDVALNAADTAVAIALRAAIAAIGGTNVFATGGSTNVVTITNKVVGTATDAADGAAPTGFAITTTLQGVNSNLKGKYCLLSSPVLNYYIWFTVDALGSDPAVATRTAIPIALVASDSANTVATKIKTALDALNGGATFTTVRVNNGLTITNGNYGAAIDVGVGNSGFTVSTSVQGSTSILSGKYFLVSSPSVNYYVWFNVDSIGVDPSVATRTAIPVVFAANATAATVGTAIKTAMNLVGGSGVFTVTGTSPALTITNQVNGPATDTAVGTSTFTIAKVQDGGNVGSFQLAAGQKISIISARAN